MPRKPVTCVCGTICTSRSWCKTCKTRAKSVRSTVVVDPHCSICGVERIHARGMCSRCYHVEYRKLVVGQTSSIDVEEYLVFPDKVKDLICCMCDRKHWAKGFCTSHYQQWRYYTKTRESRRKANGWKVSRPWQDVPVFPKNPKPRRAKGVDKRELLGDHIDVDDFWSFVQERTSNGN